MKSKPNGAYVTHMNSDFGMISVMKQTVLHPSQKWRVTYWIGFCTLL